MMTDYVGGAVKGGEGRGKSDVSKGTRGQKLAEKGRGDLSNVTTAR